MWESNFYKGAPPMYQNVYLFNLTNPDDVLQGGSPVFQEIGPYVYRLVLFRSSNYPKLALHDLSVVCRTCFLGSVSACMLCHTAEFVPLAVLIHNASGFIGKN